MKILKAKKKLHENGFEIVLPLTTNSNVIELSTSLSEIAASSPES